MMKRSESLLVYGVTGLLVIILVVAVVFGDEGPELGVGTGTGGLAAAGPEGGGTSGAMALADLMGANPAGLLEVGSPAESGESVEAESGESGEVESGETESGELELGDTADPENGELAADLEGVGPAGGSAAVVTKAVALTPIPVTHALSRRDGDYRKVTVQPGDTFSTLVQHWCGSLDHLPLAEALNEDVDPDNLLADRVVLLPWVDDNLLASARKERRVASTRLDAATGQTYKLKSGDSLWNIAVQKTGGQRRAPAYVERILQLNPGLVPERLSVGAEIVLPQ